MSAYPKTEVSVQKLLDLLKCENCQKTLHDPHTNGVCSHTLCLHCCTKSFAPPGSRSKRHAGNSNVCPLCYIPIRPCDIKPHPQLTDLVLVARKLAKLIKSAPPSLVLASSDDGEVAQDNLSFLNSVDYYHFESPSPSVAEGVVLKSTESPATTHGAIANSPVVFDTKLTTRPVVVLKNIADPEEKENRKFMPPPAGIPRAKTRALTRTKAVVEKFLSSPKAPLASPERSEMDDTVPASVVKSPPAEKQQQVKKNLSSPDSCKASKKGRVGSSICNSSFSNPESRLNSKGESALHRAAIKNDLDQLRALLSSGHSPDVRDHAGWTPLHEAALRGYVDAVKCLLDEGKASIDVLGGPELETPLHEAVFNRRIEVVRLLLEHNANPNFLNGQSVTPIQVCEHCLADANQDIINSAKAGMKGRKALKKDLSQALKDYTEIHELLVKSVKTFAERFSDNKLIGDSSASALFLERRRTKPVLLCTGLDRDQQRLVNRVANLIHARIASESSTDVTHLITGIRMLSPKEGKKRESKKDKEEKRKESSDTGLHCPRTLKYVSSVLQGCWILAFDWIETCAEMKTRVNEEAFELTGCNPSPNTYAPRRGRLAREAGSAGLFHGFRFVLLGNYSYPFPSRQILANVLTLGGGKIFHRDITSSSRLAYLAADDPIITCNWMVQDEQEDSTTQGSKATFTALDIKEDLDKVNRHQLIALYDNRTSSSSMVVSKSSSSTEGGENSTTTIALKPKELVEAALRLLKPRVMPSTGEPALVTTANYRPIKLVPASWVMISSGDYNLLSLADMDK
ncbi:unnamed protein product [Hymenolepis diminuta]|uniref:BRCA1-associated RING domain protein 1 n=1 Tax=Hymenolepis diminuta TaxID=6216 RepID=A0A0R3SV35_HYMDI|nr:unnamed protein product [Hymenolepis diminuta]VUZ51363.1 unnamed protein product [Hymenolepis diminuta]